MMGWIGWTGWARLRIERASKRTGYCKVEYYLQWRTAAGPVPGLYYTRPYYYTMLPGKYFSP